MTYTPDSNLATATDSVLGSSFSYGYDEMNRVQSATQSSGLNLSLSYDRYGNRLSQGASGSSPLTVTTSSFSVTSGTNQISGYCYDLAGNILDYTSCPDGGHNFVYDAEHRLLSSGNGATTYAYDGNGQRFAQTDSGGQRQYVYDLNGDMLLSTLVGVETNVNAYADHKLIATVDYGSGITYPYTDWLGTKRVEENGAGTATTNTCASLPFGDALTCSGTDAEAEHFTGQMHDNDSGLEYFNARYYYAASGRFMSPDTQDPSDALPFVGIDPIPYADPANPQSFNLYSYVRNNPLTNTDPDGHDVNICDNNGNCHQVTNEQYQAAQQGNNGGLNVPTLDQVGSNGNGSGQFNSTAITDSSGNTVGTATYVSNGNLDYYANANGYQQLATASRATNQVTAVYAGVYGSLALGAVAAGPAADLVAASRYRAALAAWKALSAATGAAGLINKFFKTGEVPPGLTPEMMSAYLNLAKTYISAGLGTAGGIMQSGIGTQANRIQQLENYLGR